MTIEKYETKGYDFMLACAVNRFFDYRFAETLQQRLSGFVSFEERKRIERKSSKKKLFNRRRWRGYNAQKNIELDVLQIDNYCVRFSIRYSTNSPQEEVNAIRAILKGSKLKKCL